MTNLIQQLYTESDQRDQAMRTMLASWIKANTSPHKVSKGLLPLPSPVKEWLADELAARIAYSPDMEDFSNSSAGK